MIEWITSKNYPVMLWRLAAPVPPSQCFLHEPDACDCRGVTSVRTWRPGKGDTSTAFP